MTWITGVVINVFGSLSVNLSTNLIKLAHTKNYAAAPEHGPCPKLLKSPGRWWRYSGGNRLWLFAIILFAIGNIANFVSFAFAAQSLLSALGSVQFISNVGFSKFINKERISWWVLTGTLVIVTGCILLVSFGNHESPTFTAVELQELYKSTGIIIYLAVGAVVVVAAYSVFKIGKRRVGGLNGQSLSGPWARWLPICYALFSGIPGTLSVLYGKSMSLLLRSTFGAGKNSQFDNWYTYMTFVFFAVAAMFWMTRFNKALKLFAVSTMMPILQVSWILFSMISGSLYFQETASMDTLQLAMFITGTCILLAGVWLLTTSSKPKEDTIVDGNIPILFDESSPFHIKGSVAIEQLEEGKGTGDEQFSACDGGVGRVAVVPRRHTVTISAHGGAFIQRNGLENLDPIVEDQEMGENHQVESTSIRIQRAVTAPLSGVIW